MWMYVTNSIVNQETPSGMHAFVGVYKLCICVYMI